MPARSVLIAVFLVLFTAFHTVPPPATAQPDCDAPQPLAPGAWSGRFEVQWTLRWTAELGNQPTSAETAPAVWESTGTVRGDLDLLIAEPGMESTPPVLGVARATWRTETTATREDGAQMVRRENGLLSGGSLVLPTDRPLVAGDALEWVGAWWTRPAGAADATFSLTTTLRSSTGGMLHGDGHVVAHPAGPLAFQVDSVTCRRVTGTTDPAAFGSPALGPEAGLTVVSASATFTLDRR